MVLKPLRKELKLQILKIHQKATELKRSHEYWDENPTFEEVASANGSVPPHPWTLEPGLRHEEYVYKVMREGYYSTRSSSST